MPIQAPKCSERHPDGHPIAVEDLRLVSATLRLIAMLQPTYWVIENPRGRQRSLALLAGVPRRRCGTAGSGSTVPIPPTCGAFPEGLALPTACMNGNNDHIAAPRGSRTGTQGGVSTEEAGRIPHELAERFRIAIECAWSDGRHG